jgi:TonB family protein
VIAALKEMNMIKPRFVLTSSFPAAVLLYACLSTVGLSVNARAQQSTAMIDDRVRGISLYKEGKDQEAIIALRQAVKRSEMDASAWHYLGLALSRQGKVNDARKAHEKAVKAGEALLMKIFDATNDTEFSAHISQFKLVFNEAAESADKYLELSSKPSTKKVEEWRNRAELLRELGPPKLSEYITSNTYSPRDVTTKARILSRPEPEYTERARENGVHGTVVLRGIVATDGRVIITRIVQWLPYGLTMKALKAAQKIKFIPATKDGKPVSQYIQIEYNFNLF